MRAQTGREARATRWGEARVKLGRQARAKRWRAARARLSRDERNDRGSAVAEFVMVSALIMVLALGVFQLAFALHVRVTLIDCAGEGARAAAALGADTKTGVDRTRALIESAVNPSYAQNIKASVIEKEGLELVEISVEAPLPLLGYFGPDTTLSIKGHAIVEGAL